MYSGPRLPVISKNLTSAYRHPLVLQDKIDKEVKQGRIAGPFKTPPMHNFHISTVGIFDKCLPFGCAISCRIFEMFATFLEWLVRDQSG